MLIHHYVWVSRFFFQILLYEPWKKKGEKKNTHKIDLMCETPRSFPQYHLCNLKQFAEEVVIPTGTIFCLVANMTAESGSSEGRFGRWLCVAGLLAANW